MRARWYWLGAAAVVACAFAACVDTAAPSDGVFALTDVQLPSPGVVVGDTMRDSTGQVAPLRAIAYDRRGDSIPATLTFVVLDSGAHTVGPLLIGDTVKSAVRVIASSAAIQTLPVTFAVTLSPDSLAPADSTTRVATYSLVNLDTMATSTDLTTLVQHLGTDTSGVDAVIVHYAITKAPTPRDTAPTVVLLNGEARSDRDTTSGGGFAARTLRFYVLRTQSAGVDTAVVQATASYRGHSIGTVDFTIIFKTQ